METIISREVAEADFERFCETARLDLNKPRNNNDKQDLGEQRELFIYYVMRGRLTVDDDGWPTVITQCEDLPEVRFSRRPCVPALRAMDKVKATNENGKLLAMIGDVLGVPTASWNKLEFVDFEVVSLVFALFLG